MPPGIMVLQITQNHDKEELMYTNRNPRKSGPLGLSIVPLLLALSACSTDSAAPISPGADRSATTASVASGKDRCPEWMRECAGDRNGRIAWSQFIDFTGQAIFSSRADGSDLRQLTKPVADGFEDEHPDWSPDGSTLIFERDFAADGIAQIFRMNADGSALTQLADCTGDCLGNAFPSYSPDGRKIAFIRYIGPVRDDGNATSGGIWIMNADGTGMQQVTQLKLPTTTEDSHPRWSPDGRHLVFMRLTTLAQPANRQAVFIANADGSEPRRITPWELDANVPDWSPDGRLILVSSHSDARLPGFAELFAVRPDGSGLTRIPIPGLRHAPGIDRFAENGKFSPDGRSIVFNHTEEADFCCVVYRMKADGTDLLRLSDGIHAAFAAVWGTHR